MKNQASHSQGFTLIELMIVVAIIGILAAIAVPQYQTFTRKARFTEMVTATSPFKTAVEACARDAAAAPIVGCGNGTGGVPAAPLATATIASLVTADSGEITTTPVAVNGLVAADTYVIEPTASVVAGGSLSIRWTTKGGCLAKGYCKN